MPLKSDTRWQKHFIVKPTQQQGKIAPATFSIRFQQVEIIPTAYNTTFYAVEIAQPTQQEEF